MDVPVMIEVKSMRRMSGNVQKRPDKLEAIKQQEFSGSEQNFIQTRRFTVNPGHWTQSEYYDQFGRTPVETPTSVQRESVEKRTNPGH